MVEELTKKEEERFLKFLIKHEGNCNYAIRSLDKYVLCRMCLLSIRKDDNTTVCSVPYNRDRHEKAKKLYSKIVMKKLKELQTL
jgi:hypothetical protein